MASPGLKFLKCSLTLVYRDFERTVLGVYRWLSDSYEDGDRIFLFGASERLTYHVSVNPHQFIRVFSWGISSPGALCHDRQSAILRLQFGA